MRFQSIYDIAALCYQRGIRHVVMCPGSRCAPLTLAFTRHKGFNTYTFSDERSAAFIALGMAQETNSPVLLLCTSGTAAYNFAPAVAEAFFNHIPLLIITADRPREWVAQHDGQTIFQNGIYGHHVKQSFTLPQEYEHVDNQWVINRIVNEGINLTEHEPKGPVHINAPFREPLYPEAEEEITYSNNIRTIVDFASSASLDKKEQTEVSIEWSAYHNILIVSGQNDYDAALINTLDKFSTNNPVPIVTDVISNLHGNGRFICHADTFLGQASDDVKKSLRPDLLVTFGKSVISKQLKLFLRKFAPKAHWHIQPAGSVADTFQHLTKIIRTTPMEFFENIRSVERTESFEEQKQHNFFKLWEIEERRMLRSLEQFFPQDDFGEFELVSEIIKVLPKEANLHLANSMAVRYANFIGLSSHQKSIKVFSNRGASGIDGCTSTAVGHTLSGSQMNVLITGDMAFFYDRNAFWHNYNLSNLRVVLLNNHGGVIFKMIDGPARLPEADEFFVTQQKLTAQKLCEEYGFEYLKLDHRRKVKNMLKDFFEEGNSPKILELETTSQVSKAIFESFKTHIKRSYEQ